MYTLCGAVWRLELCGVRCEIAPKCCSRRICEPCSQLGFFIVLWELAARNENLGANLSVQMDSYAYDESICTLKLALRFFFSCSRFPQNPLQTPTYGSLTLEPTCAFSGGLIDRRGAGACAEQGVNVHSVWNDVACLYGVRNLF